MSGNKSCSCHRPSTRAYIEFQRYNSSCPDCMLPFDLSAIGKSLSDAEPDTDSTEYTDSDNLSIPTISSQDSKRLIRYGHERSSAAISY